MKTIKFWSKDFRFEIPMDYTRVVIHGDSGTGKTYLVNRLLAFCTEDETPEYQSNIDLKKLTIVRDSNEAKNIKIANFEGIENRLVILDNLDTYVDKSWVNFINESNNEFIVMSRVSGAAGEIITNINSFLKLSYRVKKGVVTLTGELVM